MNRIVWLTSYLLLIVLSVSAQQKPQKWDLRTCIDYALEHNIQVKKSKISLQESQADTQLAKAQLLPSVSASVSQDFTNYPLSEEANSVTNRYTANYGVNASWKIFNGGKLIHSINQQKVQDDIMQLAVEEAENDIEIAITQTYLQLLYAYEAVQIAENTVEVSRAQLERSKAFYEAGSISQSDYAQMESQYSSDKYQLVVSQTNLDDWRLQLKQLLELDITEQMDVVIPELNEQSVLVPLPSKQTVYNTSLMVMPQIKSSQLAVRSSELQKKIAKSGFWPTLSLNAGVGTGHLSGSDYLFGQQLKNQLNENISLSLNIPIFQNLENKTAVRKANLSIDYSRLDLLDAQKNLLRDVESVYLDAVSSQNQFIAASEQLKSTELSYRLVEEQFNVGMKNTLELLTEKNNYLSARLQVLQAKYMAILNIQLLNFYQDKPIAIN